MFCRTLRRPGFRVLLLISQGKIDAVCPALWRVGEDILLHAGKPERAGHAAYAGKQIRPVNGIQRKQPGQRIPGDPPPTRGTGNLFLCRWNNLLGQKPQIVVCATGAELGIFVGRGTRGSSPDH